MNLKNMVLLFSVCFIITAQEKLPAEAWVNDDFVSVRTTPSKDGDKVGVLYKKMKVTVTERSAGKDKIGEKTDYWYKIACKDISGWTFGALIDFKNLPKDGYETYYANPDMEWFHKRYSYSTWEELEMEMTTFTLEEYRSLITAVTTEQRVAVLLYNSFYSKIEKNKDSMNKAPFPYLKEILFSPEFLSKLSYLSYYEDEVQCSPYATQIYAAVASQVNNREKLFLDITKYGPSVFDCLPEEFKKNKKFLIQLAIQNPQNFNRMSCIFGNNENAIREILDGIWKLTGKNENVYPMHRYRIISSIEDSLKQKYYSYKPKN
ncbi:MAG: SH3 domain-containing protein [Chitinispirillaceae bacterium]|nr:SH3 domain-containing protein [Chitinispirillaceae bacterium]